MTTRMVDSRVEGDFSGRAERGGGLSDGGDGDGGGQLAAVAAGVVTA